MGTFLITGPDGKKYRVKGDNAQGALSALKKHLGAPSIGALPNVDLTKLPESASVDPIAMGAQQQVEDDRAQFAALPWWAKPIVAAEDIGLLASEGGTFGLLPKGAAKIRSFVKGTPYEVERKTVDRQIEAARNRAGDAGLVAEIGSSIASPVKLAKAGLTTTKFLRNNLLGLTGDSALIGAADAFGHDGNVSEGATIDALIGAGLGLLGRGLTKTITPFRSTPERMAAANALKKEGVDLTAGQKTGNRKLLYTESEMGGGAARDFSERQGKQFTAAALRRVGETADTASPEVIDRTFVRLGKQFDALSGRNAVIASPQLWQNLNKAVVDYHGLVGPGSRAPIVETTVDNILGVFQKHGYLDGRLYQSMRSDLSRAMRGATDDNLKIALGDIIEALDDGMKNFIAKHNPRDAGAWEKVRRQYRNLMVIERAATGAGSDAAAGLISPAQLRNATVTKHGRRNYARGTGDFADLARAGETAMPKMPDSGTASRLATRMLPQAGTALATGLVGGYQQGGDPTGYIVGAMVGLGIPPATGRLIMSKLGRKYLGNQALANVGPEEIDRIARALVAAGVSAGLVGTSR